MTRNRTRIGPGALITAAFVGPGTVTVCTLAGVTDGFSLLWVMLFAIAVCYFLQEMAARIGLVTRKSLAEALRGEITSKLPRFAALTIVLVAIVGGNAAYEAGNISGGALGLQVLFGIDDVHTGKYSFNPINFLIALLAASLLYVGSYRVLERVLVSLVIVMSLAFAMAAIATKPSISSLIAGLVPAMQLNQTLTVIGLIGTTIVPYNLFLHASIVQEKWSGPEHLPHMRRDAALTICVGGLISMAVIISAAAMRGTSITNAAELAGALEPVFGSFSRYILAPGLFAAGVTSAITAPLAAAYVVSGCLGWDRNLRSTRNRLTWLSVLLAGVLFSVVGGSPIEIIRVAQIANGILLPLIVAFLLWAVNRSQLIGPFANSRSQNVFGVVVLIVVSALSLRSLWLVIGSMR